MVSFFCSSSLMKMNLDAFVIIFLASSIFQGTFSQKITFSSKSLETLMCSITSNTENALWAEVYSNGSSKATIFDYNGSSVVPKSPSIDKYNNFGYDFMENTKFHLTIQNVEKDDGGTYVCNQTPFTGVNSQTLVVEALPDSLDLTCSLSPSRICGGPDQEITSSVDCTCIATEVSSNLQLEWSISLSEVIRDETQDTGAYFTLISVVTITPTSTEESVTCSLTGYQSGGIESSLIERTYKFVPPSCTLEVSYDGMCTTAELNCECTGGMPDTYTYSFFYGNNSRIVDSMNSSIEVNIVADETFTFYCRGCNGIYGVSSLDEEADVVCTLDKINVAAAAGGAVGGCIAVGMGVLIVILVVKKREKGKGVNNDNTDGNGVNTKLAAEQPEYAAVNKPSQPQAAPRTSQAPDNKEQVELQYADLDHGKQGASKEVRKPVDEPTEYATVQSVIV